MPNKQTRQRIPPLEIENAQIRFRNFSGNEGKFNAKGIRNFCVLLDQRTAEMLKQDGWNIHYLKPRDENEPEQAYMQVRVSYLKIPPQVFLMNNGRKTTLMEDTVHILDWAEIQSIDLVINGSKWDVNGKTGVKAYLKRAYVTLVPDRFGEKYRDIPDSAMTTLQEDD